jgi:hypothetical protein
MREAVYWVGAAVTRAARELNHVIGRQLCAMAELSRNMRRAAMAGPVACPTNLPSGESNTASVNAVIAMSANATMLASVVARRKRRSVPSVPGRSP